MCLLHKYIKVKDTGKHSYFVCKKCGAKRLKVNYECGYQPIDKEYGV
jgi:hypothetical protein